MKLVNAWITADVTVLSAAASMPSTVRVEVDAMQRGPYPGACPYDAEHGGHCGATRPSNRCDQAKGTRLPDGSSLSVAGLSR